MDPDYIEKAEQATTIIAEALSGLPADVSLAILRTVKSHIKTVRDQQVVTLHTPLR